MMRRVLIGLFALSLAVPASVFAGTCCPAHAPTPHMVDQQPCCPATSCAMNASQCPSELHEQPAMASVSSSENGAHQIVESSSTVIGLHITLADANLVSSSFHSPPSGSSHAISLPLRL